MKKSLSFNNDQGCQTGVRVSSGGKEWRQGSIADCQQLSWAIAVASCYQDNAMVMMAGKKF